MVVLLIALLTVAVGDGAPSVAVDSVRWQPLPQALAAAAQARQPVLIYVHAPGCGPCRQMERDVFPEVVPLLDRFALAGLDFDDHDTGITVDGLTQSPFAWARHFGADATPAFVLLDADGALITRTTGFLDAASFSLLLAYVATGAHRHTAFDDYVRRTLQGP
jgi:thioredoxin-related protein